MVRKKYTKVMELIIVEHLVSRNAPASRQGISIHLSQKFRMDVTLKETLQVLRRAERLEYVEETESEKWVYTQAGIKALKKQKIKESVALSSIERQVITAPSTTSYKRNPNLQPAHKWAEIQNKRNGGEWSGVPVPNMPRS